MIVSKKLMIIGGSPCSGKSTAAERIAQEYGAYYFKVDDHLSELIKQAADNGSAVCNAIQQMSPEEIWMREPEVQCKEEFEVYRDIAPFVFDMISRIEADLIITEGAAYTPEVMETYTADGYVTIVPSPEFQISHYREREWVPYVLEGCSDKDKAFDYWMQRDILFAQQIQAECVTSGIPYKVNDGSESVEQLCQWAMEKLCMVDLK